MKIITTTLILVILTIFMFGCSSNAGTGENIGCEQKESPWEQRILKENEALRVENEELKTQINQLEMDKIMIEYNLTGYWEKYLWKEYYYDFAPSKCENPSSYFTMCKEGCLYKYYCDTDSMNPFFDCNAKLTFAECSNYDIGDIILFKNKYKALPNYDFLVHSIAGKEGNSFTTKGYNVNGIDSFKTYKSDIKGKVIKIEY